MSRCDHHLWAVARGLGRGANACFAATPTPAFPLGALREVLTSLSCQEDMAEQDHPAPTSGERHKALLCLPALHGAHALRGQMHGTDGA